MMGISLFHSRLRKNAVVRELEPLSLRKDSSILSDEMVVTELHLLTNRFYLEVDEIAEIYQLR